MYHSFIIFVYFYRSTPTATGSNSTNSTTTAPTTTTGQQRHSIDSIDSMEIELAGSESLENGVSNPVPPPPSTKKAIILPILGKKKNLVTPTSAATATATAVPSPSSTSGPSSVSKENSSKISDTDLCTTADSKMSKSEFTESSSAKKRGPGRPKKVKSSDTVIMLDSDQPPELEPQVTIPPIKKRLQVKYIFLYYFKFLTMNNV